MTPTVYISRDVAKLLGVTPAAVGNWLARHTTTTPAPSHQLRDGSPLWDEQGMAAWITWHQNREHGRGVAPLDDIDLLRERLTKGEK